MSTVAVPPVLPEPLELEDEPDEELEDELELESLLPHAATINANAVRSPSSAGPLSRLCTMFPPTCCAGPSPSPSCPERAARYLPSVACVAAGGPGPRRIMRGIRGPRSSMDRARAS